MVRQGPAPILSFTPNNASSCKGFDYGKKEVTRNGIGNTPLALSQNGVPTSNKITPQVHIRVPYQKQEGSGIMTV